MKMFVKEYNQTTSEPFRVEKYKDTKLEMHYFNDHPSYQKYVQSGRFSIWTSNGVDYRLLIEKGYYEKVTALYDNEINDIWLDYTNVVYESQRKMSRKYMYISLAALVAITGVSLLIQTFVEKAGDNVFLISMILLFVVLFGSSHFQQKALKELVRVENEKTSLAIRDAMGKEKFNEILKGQEEYYQEFFNVPAEDNEEMDELDYLDNNDEEKEDFIIEDDNNEK